MHTIRIGAPAGVRSPDAPSGAASDSRKGKANAAPVPLSIVRRSILRFQLSSDIGVLVGRVFADWLLGGAFGSKCADQKVNVFESTNCRGTGIDTRAGGPSGSVQAWEVYMNVYRRRSWA